MAVGARLALANASRLLSVAVLGDGDFLMGATAAVWTATHYQFPLLLRRGRQQRPSSTTTWSTRNASPPNHAAGTPGSARPSPSPARPPRDGPRPRRRPDQVTDRSALPAALAEAVAMPAPASASLPRRPGPPPTCLSVPPAKRLPLRPRLTPTPLPPPPSSCVRTPQTIKESMCHPGILYDALCAIDS